jgi:hypothetical protein
VLRNAKNVAIVATNQFLESLDITGFRALNQNQFITDRLAYLWLDCAHSSFDAGFFTLN